MKGKNCFCEDHSKGDVYYDFIFIILVPTEIPEAQKHDVIGRFCDIAYEFIIFCSLRESENIKYMQWACGDSFS